MLGCRLFLLQNDEKKKERTWMTGNIKGNSRGMEVFEGRLVYSIMDNWKTVSPQLSNPSQQPSTLSPQHLTLNPQPSTLNPQSLALSPQPSALSPQPSALSYQPSKPIHRLLLEGTMDNRGALTDD
jgi:hypothetical protein